MIVMAMDIARNTGVSYGVPGSAPTSFSFCLPTARQEKVFSHLLFETGRLIKRIKPDILFIEKPRAKGHRGGESVVYSQLGYRAIVMAQAFQMDVPIIEVSPQTIRKHFMGQGNMARSEAKTAVYRRCLALGWKPKTDDESDAMAMWDYGCMAVRAHHTATHLGLFDGGAA